MSFFAWLQTLSGPLRISSNAAHRYLVQVILPFLPFLPQSLDIVHRYLHSALVRFANGIRLLTFLPRRVCLTKAALVTLGAIERGAHLEFLQNLDVVAPY